jgi:hypothetical protein
MGSLTKNVDKARPSNVKRCSWGRWLDSLDEEDQATVADIMADLSWNATDIQKFLNSEGLGFGLNLIRRHRSGQCTECVDG